MYGKHCEIVWKTLCAAGPNFKELLCETNLEEFLELCWRSMWILFVGV